uniref:Uncharacterized protein n=1 Tax=Anguilla anguilla TaxID=7936 RepID=A0A0E9VAT5_ANGAN
MKPNTSMMLKCQCLLDFSYSLGCKLADVN